MEISTEQTSLPQKELESHKKSQKNNGAVIILFSFFFGLMGGILGWWVGPRLANDLKISLPPLLQISTNQELKKQSSAQFNPASSEESVIVPLVEKSLSSVVSVVITKDVPKYRDIFDSPGFPFFFGRQLPDQNDENSGETEKQTIGEGTGFFVSSDGTIITNRHVVDDLNADYTIITSDKKEYPAKVLARDPIQDIAIVKIEGNNFPTLEFGDSDSIRIGQTVIAIGNSLGEFSNTVSRGIVSGLKRNLVAGSGFGSSERLSGIIQTDAAINVGNSGGPLLNLSGKVIGVNVAMAQGAQNIGFAIPANSIKNAIREVRETGKISTPYLGVRYAIVTPEIQKENNLPYEYGALVIRGQKITDLAVIPGSPADKAGILENDIILEIDGAKIDSENQLGDSIGTKRVGDTITLKIFRKNETKEVKITLEERK